jgi:hypothetical protein
MVARLLQAGGLFLGREEELGFDSNNGEPHFEHLRFVALNDELLRRLGGSWNNPPEFRAGWEITPEVEALTKQGKKLIKRLNGRYYWGWKDPRNSLTLPFWRRIIPDLRLVICVRNPLEVAHSLRKRGDLIGLPYFLLWLVYYRELLSSTSPEERVVTHYESYFQDPTTELKRVADLIGMTMPVEAISRASAYISDELRHHRIKTTELATTNMPHEVFDIYLNLCREAGPVYNTNQIQSPIRSQLPREYAT